MEKERAGGITPTAHFLFLLALLLPAPLSAIAPSKNLQRLTIRETAVKAEAWNSPDWLRLLYYKKTIFGRYRSLSADPRFFLAKWGNISPRLELEALIDGLFFEGEPGDSPECAFPGRYRWLREKFKLPAAAFPQPACKSFEEWKAGLEPASVSLVFMSGHLDNLSTLYGHAFLRLHKAGAEVPDRADYTLSYAAAPGSGKGILSAVKRLTGNDPGQLEVIPYYLKIQEYPDVQERDLWEFPLSLTPDEIDRLLRHSWELTKASFSRHFLTRNSSWQLLPLLDIAKPELKLSGRLNFWAIPSDTVKAVLAGSPAAAPVWRPSARSLAEWRISGQPALSGGPPQPASLLKAHESLRLGAGLVTLGSGPAYEVQGRFAAQDMLDAPEGGMPDAALEAGAFRLRYEPRYNRFYMKEARLAHIMSLNAWDDRTRRRSGEISVGVEQAGETGRQSGRAAVWAMSAATGLAVEVSLPLRQLWYVMGVGESAFGPALNNNWRAGAGLKAGVLADQGPLRLLAEARYVSYIAGDTRPLWAGTAAAAYKIARNSSARFEYSWRGSVREAGLYFHQFLTPP